MKKKIEISSGQVLVDNNSAALTEHLKGCKRGSNWVNTENSFSAVKQTDGGKEMLMTVNSKNEVLRIN